MYESKRIEYKQKITAELEKEVVAFLNSNEGGIIYIGIDKIGNIVGIENPDEEQLLLKDRVLNIIFCLRVWGFLILFWKGMRIRIF
nr:MAG TPA: hypothetical protein [Caudoviricetes sp.]